MMRTICVYLHINDQEFYAIIQNKLHSAISPLKYDISAWAKTSYNDTFPGISYRASICNYFKRVNKH